MGETRDAGMRALVLMDGFQTSNGNAWPVNRVVPDIQTIGGVIPNTVYGGVNPRAA